MSLTSRSEPERKIAWNIRGIMVQKAELEPTLFATQNPCEVRTLSPFFPPKPGALHAAGMTGTRRWESYVPPVWITCSPLFTVDACSMICDLGIR